MTTNNAHFARSQTERAAIASKRSSRQPAIDSAAYIYDRVERIEVFREVPERIDDLGNMETWRHMVRAEAFHKLFEQVPCDQVVTIECRPLEKEESAESGRRYFVGCELRFTRTR